MLPSHKTLLLELNAHGPDHTSSLTGELKVAVLTHTYNGYDDDDNGKLEVLHAHGSGKVPAGGFESD